jgi:hypothetical protein
MIPSAVRYRELARNWIGRETWPQLLDDNAIAISRPGIGVISFGGAVVKPGSAFDAERGLGVDYW